LGNLKAGWNVMLTYLAPAKINLVLEVLGKRTDGYHEIRSLVQTISLCDVISFERADVVSLECTEPSLLTFENLVVQAAELLKKTSGYEKGVKIKLEKRIPWGAGLGGGSSDGATTLLALNKLWGLKLTTSDLVKLAARLGSDVPFFIHGGAALIEGRGEKVTTLEASVPRWFVLLIPPLPRIPNKTQRLYSYLESRHFTDGHFADRAVKSWSGEEPIDSGLFFNAFDEVAFDAFPGLKAYWERFTETGAQDIHLTGSGPALFAAVDSESGAKEIQRRLRKQKLESYAVSTIVK
jgi:4-diphosphocytidyl-2-C-methyl-D-erythritol kinase